MSNSYEIVKLARSNDRYTGNDYIRHIFTDFFELHGDRRFADDPAVVGGVALLDSLPVTVVAMEKGHSAKERMARNFGAPNPEGYRKALRLMKQAEKFHRPVICFVDTSGAYCGMGAEERGQGQAIAENLMEMMTLRTPVLSILIGEGGSGGALALAVADEVWMLENSIYSVISPEGCANILWKDAARASDAAEFLKLTASDAMKLGVVEQVIREWDKDSAEFFEQLKEKIRRTLDALRTLSPTELTQRRYRRFRLLGLPSEKGAEIE